VKKISFIFVLIALLAAMSVFSITQAVAQKESHKDYGAMKISECNDCHAGQGIAPNHDAVWRRDHRLPAARQASNCNECHQQAFCLDCHTGGGIDAQLSTRDYRRDYVPRSHRNDFLEIHPLQAKTSPQSCNRCHDQRYCTSCHSKFQSPDLQFKSHRRQFRDIPLASVGPNHANFQPADCRNCHPNGLLVSHKIWAGDHATEARRNLRSCQTCHADGDVCLKCHSAKKDATGKRLGLQVNPHPRNWGSIKDKLKSKSGGRSCVQCHDNF
jgi:hypothetical protein